MPAGYIPKSETEKALKNSLRDMEIQCKERVDLLEALKQSRLESEKESTVDDSNANIRKSSSKQRLSADLDNSEKGYIGNGTIPAVNYPELSRPPPLPQRPAILSHTSSTSAVLGVRSSSGGPSSSSARVPTVSTSGSLVPPMKKSSRSPSPEKGRTMLQTLRSDKGKKAPKPPRARREDPVTSRAASVAWQSLGKSGRDKLGRSLDADVGSTSTLTDGGRRVSSTDPTSAKNGSSGKLRWDSKTRTLVPDSSPRMPSPTEDPFHGEADLYSSSPGRSSYPFPPAEPDRNGSTSAPSPEQAALKDLLDLASNDSKLAPTNSRTPPLPPPKDAGKFEPVSYPTYLKEYPETSARKAKAEVDLPVRRRPAGAEGERISRRPIEANTSSPRHRDRHQVKDDARRESRRKSSRPIGEESSSIEDDAESSEDRAARARRKQKQKQKLKEAPILAGPTTPSSDSGGSGVDEAKSAWELKVADLMKNLPKGVDEGAAKQIFNEIVVQGDEVHWDDVAGLEIAKKALKEAVVYPFLRPDLFMGLREPARGMLLFGPPGTGKTMLARAVATESKSTFFSISASSLTSKYLGESEKLVRALFSIAKALAPSIIFVDEIDSLLGQRSGSGEHEATRRIKTEFLIQWSDLQRAAAGREQSDKEKARGDASRVLVLAATNLPWAIDEAAIRRFVRRQYIPLPEDETRATQLRTLLGHQKHSLTEADIQRLVMLTTGKLPVKS